MENSRINIHLLCEELHQKLGELFYPVAQGGAHWSGGGRRLMIGQIDKMAENIRKNPIPGDDWNLAENDITMFQRTLKELQRKRRTKDFGQIERLIDEAG